MTHGSAGEGRQEIIDTLMAARPDFGISKVCGGYSINSYDGLDKILQIINDGLVDAETTAKTLKIQIN